jgi:hypothetical protein
MAFGAPESGCVPELTSVRDEPQSTMAGDEEAAP